MCRSPGENFYAAMSNTAHNLKLTFKEHGYGSDMGTLRVYTDSLAASNHANADLIATITGQTRTSNGAA